MGLSVGGGEIGSSSGGFFVFFKVSDFLFYGSMLEGSSSFFCFGSFMCFSFLDFF